VKKQQQTQDDYRRQIVGCAQALAAARNSMVEPHVAGLQAGIRIAMFTDGNRDKRVFKLKDRLDDLSAAFEDFESLIVEYISKIPLLAYDTGPSDSERFLRWLPRGHALTAEQLDYVTCQRCRNAVEMNAAGNRLAHVRFQELWPSWRRLASELQSSTHVWIHLNPIRAWGTFRTFSLLDEEATLPATVLFFPVGDDIRTAVLEPEGRRVVEQLRDVGPVRFDEMAPVVLQTKPAQARGICHDLAEIGLAALG